MKKLFSIPAICAVLAMGHAYAQTHTFLRADVPFSFRVGKTEMPAGKYEILDGSVSRAIVLIRSADSASKAMVLTNDRRKSHPPQQGSLVFHRYGDTYFLSGIWQAGYLEGRELIPTAAEREVATHSTKTFELASVPAQP